MNLHLERQRRACMAVTLAVLLMPGCGGSGGVDSGGTGITVTTLAVGPISGFGSVVVAGVHYDESLARLVDGDNQPLGASALVLGAMVSIDAGDISTVGTRQQAVAQTMRVSELLVGPVELIDTVGLTLKVLGQTVAITAGTVFDARLTGGLAALAPGAVVAVHGQIDSAAARDVATRIEPRPNPLQYLLRGTVTSYDRSTRRLTVGAQVISFADVATPPDSIASGGIVRLKLRTASAGGVWAATDLRLDGQTVPDRNNVEIEGRVSAFTSAQHFSVDGVVVDASAATMGGGAVAPGARVEVEGRSSNGMIMARRVTVDAQEGGGDQAIEVEGRITALDTIAKTFVVRDQTVSYAGNPRFVVGTTADLAVNRSVNVKGRLSADRTQIQATTIHLEL